MFGSGKRWSVVEYTHRKCLTIDISMMFFFVSFSLIFLFAFSSPLFFRFSCLIFFLLLGIQQASFWCSAVAIGQHFKLPGICNQQNGNCTARKFFLFYFFFLFPMKVAWENPRLPALSDSPVGGKSFWECLQDLRIR